MMYLGNGFVQGMSAHQENSPATDYMRHSKIVHVNATIVVSTNKTGRRRRVHVWLIETIEEEGVKVKVCNPVGSFDFNNFKGVTHEQISPNTGERYTKWHTT